MEKTVKRTPVRADLIIYLNSRLIEKFKSEHPGESYDKKSEAQLYGFDNYDPQTGSKFKESDQSLKTYICNHTAVKARRLVRKIENRSMSSDDNPAGQSKLDVYKDFDGKYLWKKKDEAKKASSNQEITFSDDYMDMFLACLGLKDINALKNDYNDSFTHYIGFYLSFTGFQIRNFLMQVSSLANEEGKHKSYIRGIHIRKGAEDLEEYEGEAMYEGKFMYATFRGTGELRKRLQLIGAVEVGNKNMEYIRGCLQGTTHDDKIFAWEVFFCKKDKRLVDENKTDKFDLQGYVKHSILQLDELKTVSFYLALHRNLISIQNKAIEVPSTLMSRGSRVAIFTRLAGAYQLWNFNFYNNKIAQSLFVITEEGTAFLYPYVPDDLSDNQDVKRYLKKQRALINVSNLHENNSIYKVVAITFAKGLNMVNVAMFDFADVDGIVEGSFSSLGFKRHSNISGYFVMQKKDIPIDPIREEEKSDEIAAQYVSEMSFPEALEYARQHDMLKMFRKLCLMKKSKHLDVMSAKENMIHDLIAEIDAAIAASGEAGNHAEEIATWE